MGYPPSYCDLHLHPHIAPPTSHYLPYNANANAASPTAAAAGPTFAAMPIPTAALALPLIEPVAVELDVLVADPLSDDIDPVAVALPDIAELGSAAIAP